MASERRTFTAHDCPVEGCERKKPRAHLMCKPHWRRVPRGLQHEVYASARAMQENFGDEEAYNRWRADATSACEAVEGDGPSPQESLAL